jgi:mRNA interferase RelE/StbE
VTTFRIELRPAAARALRKLDPAVRFRMQGAIALLADDPRPPASRPLRGRPGYRVRVGNYRIIYTVADDVLLIVVVTLGHRPTPDAKGSLTQAGGGVYGFGNARVVGSLPSLGVVPTAPTSASWPSQPERATGWSEPPAACWP